MNVTGIIFASVDCDADAIEAWNRWYDLAHLPPNISLPGILSGRRYVAPPELHEMRGPNPLDGFAGGRGVHTTIYLLCDDPATVIAEMTRVRDVLENAGRMFAPEKKVVRAGDALHLRWVAGGAEAMADDIDVPFIAHVAKLVLIREAAADADAIDAWYRDSWAPAALDVDGVVAVMGLDSAFAPGRRMDLVYLAGEPADVVPRLRESAPHHPGAAILLDAPFVAIEPLRYPWADRIRNSWLPQTIA